MADAPSILIVDDTPANLVSAVATLEPLAFDLVTASSGAEALSLARSRDFVTMLIDVHMPELDGYETAARLRQLERAEDVPIVFMTAIYNEKAHTHRGYALGAVDYVTKPVDTVVLRAKVRALVSLYQRGQGAERARSQELDRIKDLFLGAVGHDLRNPLNTILMGAKLLAARDCGEASHRELAARVERAGLRMGRIIEDILDLTRGQFTEGIPLVLTETDLREVCVTVIAELRTAQPARQLDLIASPGIVGLWDAGRLARVLSNLVGNAIQHSSGPIRVTLSDGRARVVVDVHSDGAPIPREVQARLFEPFRRGDTSAEGLGLGLYIVKEIVTAHGGEVLVRSTERSGTSFIVDLPKRPSSSPES